MLPRRLGLALLYVAFALIAYFLAVGPRADFPYPIHVDEWTHLAYAEVLVQEGRVPHSDPLYGEERVGYRPELGFRVVLAQLHLATGLDWEAMFPALAGGTFVLFTLMCLYLGRALGVGALVGVLALGTPTTLRFLGPAFVVPVALGLTLLVALAIVLLRASRQSQWHNVMLSTCLLLAILLVHPPTALVAAPLQIAMASYGALRQSKRRAAPLWAIAAIGVLLPLSWFLAVSGPLRSELVDELQRGVASGEGLILEYAYYAGYGRIVVFAIAVFTILLIRPRPPYLALVAAYGAMLVFIRLHELRVVPMAYFYDRSWLYLDLLLSIIGGLGAHALVTRVRFMPRVIRHGGLVLLTAIVVVSPAWYTRSHEPLYRITTTTALDDFRWIQENLRDTPGLTLLDPATAIVYPAVAGRAVYASASRPKPSPPERTERAIQLLKSPKPDVAGLRRENIGIVYKPTWKAADGLVEIRPGIFVVVGES